MIAGSLLALAVVVTAIILVVYYAVESSRSPTADRLAPYEELTAAP